MGNKGKVGIVSLFVGQNFGNKLQNYAVEKIVKKYEYEPETFTYESNNVRPVKVSVKDKIKPSYVASYIKIILQTKLPLKNSDSSFICKCIWQLKNGQVAEKAKKNRIKKYEEFDKQYLHFSDRVIALGEENSEWADSYSAFLCGSDQVWNPYYPSTSGTCFLQFAPKEKRIAIAPSFGVSEIPEDRKDDYRKWIADIMHLSVREETGALMIKNLTGKNAIVISDPTMYLSEEDWRKFESRPSFDLPEKYILTYFLGDRTKKYSAYVNKIADKYGLEIVNLFDLMQPEYYTCSPDEFVYCIDNASAVCTDSFHACVFSIIFEKPFKVFERIEGGKSMSSRIVTLLKKFGLEENMYDGKNSKDCHETNFKNCKDILSKEKIKTDKFLKESFL